MTKAKETKQSQQKFGKEAFLNAAENAKDQMVIQVVLKDGTSYTREEADKLIEAWKNKEVKQ